MMAASIESDQVPFLSTSSQGIDMIEGELTSAIRQTDQNQLSTLDEPVIETIKRSLKFGFLFLYSLFF